MPKTIKGICLGLGLFGLLTLRAMADAIVLTDYWPPWLIAHDKEHQHITDGPGVHLLQEVFRRMGVAIRFETIPFQRALPRVEKGRADMTPFIVRNADRERYMAFTDPLYTDQLLLVASAENGDADRCDWNRPGVLTGKTIGTVHGYSYGQRWDDLLRQGGFQVIEANNDLTNLKKVAGGRLDYTLQFYSHLRPSLADNGINARQLEICTRPLQKIKLYLGISRKSPLAKRVAEFNRTLQAMKKDGTYRAILGNLYRDETQPPSTP